MVIKKVNKRQKKKIAYYREAMHRFKNDPENVTWQDVEAHRNSFTEPSMEPPSRTIVSKYRDLKGNTDMGFEPERRQQFVDNSNRKLGTLRYGISKEAGHTKNALVRLGRSTGNAVRRGANFAAREGGKVRHAGTDYIERVDREANERLNRYEKDYGSRNPNFYDEGEQIEQNVDVQLQDPYIEPDIEPDFGEEQYQRRKKKPRKKAAKKIGSKKTGKQKHNRNSKDKDSLKEWNAYDPNRKVESSIFANRRKKPAKQKHTWTPEDDKADLIKRGKYIDPFKNTKDPLDEKYRRSKQKPTKKPIKRKTTKKKITNSKKK